MDHFDLERDIAEEFERTTVLPVVFNHHQFIYQTCLGDRYKIWYSDHAVEKPWITAKMAEIQNGEHKGLQYCENHAGHATLRVALNWLQALE